MSQKIKKIVVLSFVLIISSVFTRCQKEDDVSSPQSSQLSLARNWFKEYESSGENYALFQNLAYDWNEASITKSEDGTATIIVPVIELKKDQKEIWEQKLYLYKSGTDSYKTVLFEIYSNKNIEVSSQTIEGGDFTGYMTAWDLKTGFVRAAKFINNQVVEIGDAEFSNDISLTSRAPIEAPCVYSGGDGGCDKGGGKGIEVLREVVVTGPSTGSPVVYIPRDAVTGGTSTGGFTSPGAGGASSGGGITVPTPAKIIDALTGKAKCLNALLNKNGNSFVQNLLANFAGTSEFDIKIVSTEKTTNLDKNGALKEVNGKTIHLPGSALITIEISNSRANANAALDVARTILHEYIHADIFRKLNTTSGEIGNKSTDFKKTYDEYENHHGAIAGLYLKSMKEALKEFHKNVLNDDYNKYINYFGEAPSDAFYEALAWGGLRDNDVKAWTDLPTEKKAAIEALGSRVPLLSKIVPCSN